MPVGDEYSISTLSSASTISSTGFPSSGFVVGDGEGEGFGDGLGVAEAATVGDGLGVALGVGLGEGLAFGVGDAVAIGDGVSAGVETGDGVAVGAGVGVDMPASDVIGAVADVWGPAVVAVSDSDSEDGFTGVAPSIVCSTSDDGTSASLEYLSIIFLVKIIKPTRTIPTTKAAIVFVLRPC